MSLTDLTREQRREALAMYERLGIGNLHSRIGLAVAQFKLYSYSIPDSRQAEATGWPDRVIIGPNGILFREEKSEPGELSRQQKWVGRELQMRGLDFAVWRPSDHLSGKVRDELARIAR